jgi:hypothetical protein
MTGTRPGTAGHHERAADQSREHQATVDALHVGAEPHNSFSDACSRPVCTEEIGNGMHHAMRGAHLTLPGSCAGAGEPVESAITQAAINPYTNKTSWLKKQETIRKTTTGKADRVAPSR